MTLIEPEVPATKIVALIQHTLGVDITTPASRQRAWRRLSVFRQIATECEQDGNAAMAETLRRICHAAVSAVQDDHTLIRLAILAGPDR